MKLKNILLTLTIFLLILPMTFAALDKLSTVDAKTIITSSITEQTKDQYLDITDKDKYEYDGGKLHTTCNNCDIGFNICNVDGQVNLGLDVFHESYKDLSQVIMNISYYWEHEKTFLNGSTETVKEPYTVKQFTDMLQNKPLGTCEKFGMSFKLDEDPIDIIPIMNGVSFDEYAWFYPFLGGSGDGFQCTMQDPTFVFNNSLIYYWEFPCERLDDSTNTIKINEMRAVGNGGDLIFNNEPNHSPYVNDTATNPYGAYYMNGNGASDSDTSLGSQDQLHVRYLNVSNNNMSFTVTNNDDFFMNFWAYTSGIGSTVVLLRFADNNFAKDTIQIFKTPTGKYQAIFQDTVGASTRMELIGATDHTSGLNMVTYVYNATSNLLSLYIDGVLENSLSSTGVNMAFDGGDTPSYYFANTFFGYMSQFTLKQGSLSPSDITDLYNVAHISSLLYNMSDNTNISLIEGEFFEFDYTVDDVIDGGNITYFENSPDATISSTGFFNFSTTTLGTHFVTVNATDGYGNWVFDDIEFFVSLGVNITDTCPNVDIYHNQDFSCSPNATNQGTDNILWSVNDSRVNITGLNTTALLFDNPNPTDYNLPDCWDVNVTAESGTSSDSFTFVYCINNTAPVLTGASFIGAPYTNLDTALLQVTVSDSDDVLVIKNVSWYVNGIFVLNDQIETAPGTSSLSFDLSSYIIDDVIRADLIVKDSTFSNSTTYTTTITGKTDGSLVQGVCPSLDAEIKILYLGFFMLIAMFMLGVYLNNSFILLFVGIGISIFGYYIFPCIGVVGHLTILSGIFIIIASFLGTDIRKDIRNT